MTIANTSRYHWDSVSGCQHVPPCCDTAGLQADWILLRGLFTQPSCVWWRIRPSLGTYFLVPAGSKSIVSRSQCHRLIFFNIWTFSIAFKCSTKMKKSYEIIQNTVWKMKQNIKKLLKNSMDNTRVAELGSLSLGEKMVMKIFVRVQTFQRGPPVPPHNFCHPGLIMVCQLSRTMK